MHGVTRHLTEAAKPAVSVRLRKYLAILRNVSMVSLTDFIGCISRCTDFLMSEIDADPHCTVCLLGRFAMSGKNRSFKFCGEL